MEQVLPLGKIYFGAVLKKGQLSEIAREKK